MTTLVAAERELSDRRRTGWPPEGLGMNRKPRFAIAVTVRVLRLALPADLRGGAVQLQHQEVAHRLRGLVAALVRGVLPRRRTDRVASTSLVMAAVAMVGSLVLGVMLAFGLVARPLAVGRCRHVITLLPLVTPEIVTGVASLLLFTGVGLQALADHGDARRDHLLDLLRHGDRARPRRRAQPARSRRPPSTWAPRRFQALRLVTLPVMWPAIMSAALLVFALVFDDFVLAFFTSGVDPQPLSVRIYSSIRFGVQPAINAVGTLMLVGSLVLIAIALLIPRLFGRRGNSFDLIRRITGHDH